MEQGGGGFCQQIYLPSEMIVQRATHLPTPSYEVSSAEKWINTHNTTRVRTNPRYDAVDVLKAKLTKKVIANILEINGKNLFTVRMRELIERETKDEALLDTIQQIADRNWIELPESQKDVYFRKGLESIADDWKFEVNFTELDFKVAGVDTITGVNRPGKLWFVVSVAAFGLDGLVGTMCSETIETEETVARQLIGTSVKIPISGMKMLPPLIPVTPMPKKRQLVAPASTVLGPSIPGVVAFGPKVPIPNKCRKTPAKTIQNLRYILPNLVLTINLSDPDPMIPTMLWSQAQFESGMIPVVKTRPPTIKPPTIKLQMVKPPRKHIKKVTQVKPRSSLALAPRSYKPPIPLNIETTIQVPTTAKEPLPVFTKLKSSLKKPKPKPSNQPVQLRLAGQYSKKGLVSAPYFSEEFYPQEQRGFDFYMERQTGQSSIVLDESSSNLLECSLYSKLYWEANPQFRLGATRKEPLKPFGDLDDLQDMYFG